MTYWLVVSMRGNNVTLVFGQRLIGVPGSRQVLHYTKHMRSRITGASSERFTLPFPLPTNRICSLAAPYIAISHIHHFAQ